MLYRLPYYIKSNMRRAYSLCLLCAKYWFYLIFYKLGYLHKMTRENRIVCFIYVDNIIFIYENISNVFPETINLHC